MKTKLLLVLASVALITGCKGKGDKLVEVGREEFIELVKSAESQESGNTKATIKIHCSVKKVETDRTYYSVYKDGAWTRWVDEELKVTAEGDKYNDYYDTDYIPFISASDTAKNGRLGEGDAHFYTKGSTFIIENTGEEQGRSDYGIFKYTFDKYGLLTEFTSERGSDAKETHGYVFTLTGKVAYSK